MEDIQIKTKFCKFCGEKIPEDASTLIVSKRIKGTVA